MNEKQIEFLKNKIVELSYLIDKKLDDKKNLNKSYSEVIKQSKKKMRNFTSAVKLESDDILQEEMSETEYADYSRIK